MSAVMVHVSHACKNMDMARERISLILELMVMFLSFQMTFSLVTAAVVWAVLDSTSGLVPRCLKLTDDLFNVVWILQLMREDGREKEKQPGTYYLASDFTILGGDGSFMYITIFFRF